LLAEIFSYIKISDVKSGDKVIVEKIKFLFEEHLYGTIDLQTLSDELGYSKSKIISIFKAYSGLSPYQYFLNMKVNKAKEWLENDTFSVKEISLNLSFSDPLYFTRLFKKKTGFAPTKWRIYH
ncbi:MAG: helix-turn-helix domain-containing protein, partial [Sphaerochaetaceae bacterium]